MWDKRIGRTTVITLRLTPEEHDRLRKDATRMYLPLSAYIRHRLFGRETVRQSRGRRKAK